MTTEERWLPVVGYEGYYEVSDQGRVRSLDRVILHPSKGETRRRGAIMTQHKSKSGGYPAVRLSRDGVGRVTKVHRLVAEAFIPNPEDKPFVLHWDDNPDNPSVENLRWGDRLDNAQDSVRNGVHPHAKKANCPMGHPLEAPNLVPSSLKAGLRGCLACSRGKGFAAYRGVDFTKELADEKYRELVTNIEGELP